MVALAQNLPSLEKRLANRRKTQDHWVTTKADTHLGGSLTECPPKPQPVLRSLYRQQQFPYGKIIATRIEAVMPLRAVSERGTQPPTWHSKDIKDVAISENKNHRKTNRIRPLLRYQTLQQMELTLPWEHSMCSQRP